MCGICGKTNWVSRNVLSREQSAPFGDVENEVLLETTSGPWEVREPGLFSSGCGKASEHAVISSFPVCCRWNKRARCYFQFFCRGHSALALSDQTCDKHARVIWRVAWNSYSYTYCATHVLCTPCTGCSLWSRAGVTGYVHQQKGTQTRNVLAAIQGAQKCST